MDVAEKEQRDGGNAVSIVWHYRHKSFVLGFGRMSLPTHGDEAMPMNQLP